MHDSDEASDPAEKMNDVPFETVARVGEIKEDEGAVFPVNGTMVAIFLHEGEYYALNDFCPHMGASLSCGAVEKGQVYCPWHAWRFALKDGLWLDNPKGKVHCASYSVRIVNDEIQVKVEPPSDQTPPSYSKE